ncbi:MAG TPA: extracellular solute-binding protein [Chloroflexota bacterium]|nr:extracellular solute-binding protein [Chloroflexota bacterium]
MTSIGNACRRAKWTACLSIGIGLLALAACGSPAAQPSGVAGSSAGSAAAGQPWDDVVAAAKKEGKLGLLGPTGDVLRQALIDPFQAKYGISVDYLGAGGPEVTPRVQKERAAGLFSWDAFMLGTDTLVSGLKPLGAIDPIQSALVLPEVKDPKYWRDGKLPLYDSEGTMLTVLRHAATYLYYNSDQVQESELASWRDLLNPKLKGKLLIGRDPRLSGYGRAVFQFLYMKDGLGPDFIRALAQQNPTILRDDHTSAQWLAQGKFPICICSDVEANQLMVAGVQAVKYAGIMKEGTHVTGAQFNLALANRAPHPNAAKVFINWLLSQEGSAAFSKTAGYPSTRADVPTDQMPAWSIPQPDDVDINTPAAVEIEKPLLVLLNEVLPSAN